MDYKIIRNISQMYSIPFSRYIIYPGYNFKTNGEFQTKTMKLYITIKHGLYKQTNHNLGEVPTSE